jgi:hypothetical protein
MVPVPFVILLRASNQQSSTVFLHLDIIILLAIERYSLVSLAIRFRLIQAMNSTLSITQIY